MSGTIPTLQALVTVIKANGNYAKFFVLGMAFNITPKQLHDYLMELEKLDLVDLSAVAEPRDYDQATLDEWSIPKISGGNLFFASIPDATNDVEHKGSKGCSNQAADVTVKKVAQGTRQKQTKKATLNTSKENKSTKDNDMTSATSTIETLIQSIEAQANNSKPV